LRALQHQTNLDDQSCCYTLELEQHNRARGVRLQRFKLTKAEWDLLAQLHPLLDIFLEATKKISQTNTPLLHEVIPIFDILTHALDDFVGDEDKLPAVRAAARRGHAMLDKYYGITDESIMYRIAMCTLHYHFQTCLTFRPAVLHPRYKSMYFHKAKWPRDWIQMAEGLLRAQFNQFYKTAVEEPAQTVII
jgi:hypothetical protein